jgi:hypothetical protein
MLIYINIVFRTALITLGITPIINKILLINKTNEIFVNNVRCKSSERNVEIACDPTEHGRNSIVFLSDRAESLD